MTSHVRGKYTEDKTDQQTLAATEKNKENEKDKLQQREKRKKKKTGKGEIYINDQSGAAGEATEVKPSTIDSSEPQRNVPCQPFSLIRYSPLGRVITKRPLR